MKVLGVNFFLKHSVYIHVNFLFFFFKANPDKADLNELNYKQND